MHLLVLICLMLFFGLPAYAVSKEEVYLYTYHNKPPFVTNLSKRQGLYFDIAKVLTNKSSKFQFTTVYLPRKRLDLMIEQEQLDGIVLGVSPVWFRDKAETRFLWSPGFYHDRDEFVSLKSTPFEFDGDKSFEGKSVASVAGYYYAGINEAVKSGALERIDTIGERQVLQLIEKRRANFGLVSQSALKYLMRDGQITDIYHLSRIPHDSFSRRAFTTKNNDIIFDETITLLFDLMETNDWSAVLSEYQ